MNLFIFILGVLGFIIGYILAMIRCPYDPIMELARKWISGALMLGSIPVMLFYLGEMIR